MHKKLAVILTAIFLGTLTACNTQITVIPAEEASKNPIPTNTGPPTVDPTATPTPEPPRILTVCLGQEPASLFLYADSSLAAQSVRQAIYDGPYDTLRYEISPVILQKMPSLAEGDVFLQPVEVSPGELILDAGGNWVTLDADISYYPAGCDNSECALSYEGQQPVQMDEMDDHFKILPGATWSDGTPLTAHDSVYAFQVFEALFQDLSPEVLWQTRSYTALEDQTVEWVGIPGFRGGYARKFFTPLPKHLWENLAPAELLTAEISSRTPLGWGPYVIEEWTAGDHISLRRNPNYFRADEGLPHFDYLVFRFMASSEEAIDALLVGECDIIDRSVPLEAEVPRLLEEQQAGNLTLMTQIGRAWELLAFGIDPLTTERYDLFEPPEVRRAIAHCIDRQAIVDRFLHGISTVPVTFVPPAHPLSEPDLPVYEFDPEEAAAIFASAGWVDLDQDPETPLTSSGISGIPDGTPFEFTYLVPEDAERPEVAEFIAAGLKQCGLGIEIDPDEWAAIFEPGPEGPVFGRQFDLAQFAWSVSIEPACYLFTSQEIPGDYPDHPKGWGGANLTGYQNPQFDEHCRQATFSIPGSERYFEAHRQTQVIFAEDLPVIPLYQRLRFTAMRPDMCGVGFDPATNSGLDLIETFDYGASCQ